MYKRDKLGNGVGKKAHHQKRWKYSAKKFEIYPPGSGGRFWAGKIKLEPNFKKLSFDGFYWDASEEQTFKETLILLKTNDHFYDAVVRHIPLRLT